MYLAHLIGHMLPATGLRAAEAENGTSKSTTRDIATLSDRQLSDIGYVRERIVVPRRHLLRM